MTAPANRPIPKADNVFATAKGTPMMPAVMMSMLGEVIGDESQNAMTGASGRPRRRRVAMRGSAPRPHTGVTEPTKLAIHHRADRATGEPGERSVGPVAERQGTGEQGGHRDHRKQREHTPATRGQHPGIGLGQQ